MSHAQGEISPDGGVSSVRHGKHNLDEMDAARVAKHLVLFRPNDSTVERLLAKARASIPGFGKTEVIQNVLHQQLGEMHAIARKPRSGEAPVAEGFVLILLLNEIGLMQLALGTFNGPDPDLRLLAKPHERPAGIYIWGLLAPGPLAPGVALFMREMLAPRYAGVNFYSRPNTEVGRRFNETVGLTQGVQIGPIDAPNIWVFQRNPPVPLYDSYVPGASQREIGVTVARTLEDMMRVAAIRNVVYMGEQECPYYEEYDGNDLSATHLLAYIGDEPVGCLRLRFFADFAKFERMAIRKEFRKSHAAIQLARAGFKLCQKKGYARVYGHVQERLVPFWSRFGFRMRENTRRFVFSDFEYIEIVADIERDPEAVTLEAEPYVLIRPEGRWHIPGILEKSASRAVTKTLVAKKR